LGLVKYWFSGIDKNTGIRVSEFLSQGLLVHQHCVTKYLAPRSKQALKFEVKKAYKRWPAITGHFLSATD
jgi:hypothetical protein